jgi:hypothetical protein
MSHLSIGHCRVLRFGHAWVLHRRQSRNLPLLPLSLSGGARRCPTAHGKFGRLAAGCAQCYPRLSPHCSSRRRGSAKRHRSCRSYLKRRDRLGSAATAPRLEANPITSAFSLMAFGAARMRTCIGRSLALQTTLKL